MKLFLFMLAFLALVALGNSSSSEESLFRLSPSMMSTDDEVKQLAVSYMLQAVAEGNTFTVKDVIYDYGSKGMKAAAHVRLERFYQGIQVLGGDSVVHINGTDMSLLGISQTFESPITIDSSFISEVNTQASKQGHSLTIYDNGGVPTLSWDVIKTGVASDGTPMVVHYINDTETGKNLFRYSDTKTFLSTGWPGFPLSKERELGDETNDVGMLSLRNTVTCSSSEAVVGVGFTQHSGKVSLYTSFSDGVYQLKDAERYCHFTANYCGNPSANINSPEFFDDDNFNDDQTDFCSGTLSETFDNIWGDTTSSNEDTASADAHFGHAASFDFFLNHFGRQGIYGDGRGVYSRVHAGQNLNNAFWDTKHGVMSYGDGDGVEFKPFTALEIVSHELTHGIIDATSELVYAGESGGLNEATSDIMGILVDFHSRDRSVYNPNYFIGETLSYQSGRFLRSMIQPSDDGVSYDCFCSIDFTKVDVHFSSGIANHFFYLLAEGTNNGSPSRTCNVGDCRKATGSGTLIGIGREKAGNIWYRALTIYFTSQTNFVMARFATVQAAKDLYTDTEVEAVNKAWAAVNVGGLTSFRRTSKPSNSSSGYYAPPPSPTSSVRTGETTSTSPTAFKIQSPSPSSTLRTEKPKTSFGG